MAYAVRIIGAAVAGKMKGDKIRYRAGFKYQLAKQYHTNIAPILPVQSVDTEFIKLDRMGNLEIAEGYAWDGPSGPAIDTPNFMRGSLVHDAMYQLMREKHIGQEHREAADKILRRICREDGMSWLRSQYVYQGVQRFAARAAIAQENPEIEAP